MKTPGRHKPNIGADARRTKIQHRSCSDSPVTWCSPQEFPYGGWAGSLIQLQRRADTQGSRLTSRLKLYLTIWDCLGSSVFPNGSQLWGEVSCQAGHQNVVPPGGRPVKIEWQKGAEKRRKKEKESRKGSPTQTWYGLTERYEPWERGRGGEREQSFYGALTWKLNKSENKRNIFVHVNVFLQ